MKSSKNKIMNQLLGYAKNNDIQNMHNYIKKNENIFKDISISYGAEVNPVLREIYNTAFQHENYKFASEYQRDIQDLLGDNILFIDE